MNNSAKKYNVALKYRLFDNTSNPFSYLQNNGVINRLRYDTCMNP